MLFSFPTVVLGETESDTFRVDGNGVVFVDGLKWPLRNCIAVHIDMHKSDWPQSIL